MSGSGSESKTSDAGLIVSFAAAFVLSVFAFLWRVSGESEHVSSVAMAIGFASVPVAGGSGLVLLLFGLEAVRKNARNRRVYVAAKLSLAVLALALLAFVCALALTREKAASIYVTAVIVPDGKGVLYANGRLVGPVPGDYSLHAFEEWLDGEPMPRNAKGSDVRLFDTGIGIARLVTNAMADNSSDPWMFYQRGRVSGSVRLSVSDSQSRRTRMSFVTHATLPSRSRMLIITFSAEDSKP